MSDAPRVMLEVDGDGVARLTFGHPCRLDAITAAMRRALPRLLDRVEEDRAVRVLLLQGAGERAFCTGNDTSEFDAIRADAAQSAASPTGWRTSPSWWTWSASPPRGAWR